MGPHDITQGTLTAGGDYDLHFEGAKLTITAKGLTVDGAVAKTKIYDGDAHAGLDFSGATLKGVVGSDVVSLNSAAATGEFDNAKVGTGKPVTVTGVDLAGAAAGNYTVTQPTGLTADITAKGLTVDGAVAKNKIYDGEKAATVDFTGATLNSVVGQRRRLAQQRRCHGRVQQRQRRHRQAGDGDGRGSGRRRRRQLRGRAADRPYGRHHGEGPDG